MIRRIAAVLFAAFLVVTGGSALAEPPTTNTIHEKGLVETFEDVVPTCDEEDGELHEITLTSNLVIHETIFDDGRIHATFTQTGRFVAEPVDGTGPTYRGKVTIWGGFNQNGKTVNGTFTFNLRATGSDGSVIRLHAVEHFNHRPDGSVNEFFHCHD
jgi:hypothetical protein